MSLPPLVEPTADLTVDEVRRYRHIIIPEIGMTGRNDSRAPGPLSVEPVASGPRR